MKGQQRNAFINSLYQKENPYTSNFSERNSISISDSSYRKLKRNKKTNCEVGQLQLYSNHHKSYEGNNLINFRNGVEGKSFRIKTEESKPIDYNKPNRINNESIKIKIQQKQHSHQYSRQVQQAKRQKDLENRAKQFVHLVNQQRQRIKGRLFALKHRQEERKQLKNQIQQYEKDMIRYHCQERRRTQAFQNMELLAKKAYERQQELSKSKLNVQASKQIKTSHHRQKTLQNRYKKQVNHSDYQKNSFLATKSHLQFLSTGFPKKRKSEQKKFHNEVYLDEQDKKVEEVRKKLVELNRMMKRQMQMFREYKQ